MLFLVDSCIPAGNGQIYATRGVPYYRVSRIFMSRIFHPCNMVPHFHVPQFDVSHFQRPRLSLTSRRVSCFHLSPLFSSLSVHVGRRHKTIELPSVCLSRRSTATAAAGGFAAEVGRRQQISIDSCCSARLAGRVNIRPTARRSSILVSTILFGVCLRKPTGVHECASSIRRLSTPCGQLNELRKKRIIYFLLPGVQCPY